MDREKELYDICWYERDVFAFTSVNRWFPFAAFYDMLLMTLMFISKQTSVAGTVYMK